MELTTRPIQAWASNILYNVLPELVKSDHSSVLVVADTDD